MNPQRILFTVAGATLALAGFSSELNAQAHISGMVSGPNGPEAGVWVIAETRELPTKFARIVVTDEHGRFLVPDLPQARYEVWVRGYGLVDSPKASAAPGDTLELRYLVQDGYLYLLDEKMFRIVELPGYDVGPSGWTSRFGNNQASRRER